MATERTPLATSLPSGPSYVIFPRGSGSRVRQRQVRQFQCCICAAFVAILAIVVVITVAYTMKNSSDDLLPTPSVPTNETIDIELGLENSNNTIEALIYLLKQDWPVKDEMIPNWNLPEPNAYDRDEALNSGKKALGEREILEESVGCPFVNSPSFRHQKSISTSAEARAISKRGSVENHATKEIVKKITNKNSSYNPSSSNKRWTVGKGLAVDLGDISKIANCDFNVKFRTANGTCNNKVNAQSYGVALKPFRRALSPDYEDGISLPRASHSGKPLPSARQISINVHRPSYQTDPHFTVMLAVWGQFLDHDITATALHQGQNGQPIECCDDTKPKHPECFPVPLVKGDPYFDDFNMTCMNFVRSAPAATGYLGPREQLNQATAFIDGSVVYGSSDARIDSLRTKINGELRMYHTPDERTLLPVSTDPNDGCNERVQNAEGKYCFESGDARANENLHLTSMHLILARHHNYLTSNLRNENPNWDDERLFQEARKILGAQMQHITYNEFLPILLGQKFTEKIKLIPKSHNGSDIYNKSVDPSIANSFAGAAFRFAHTLLPGLMRLTQNESSPDGVALHKMLFNPYSLWKNNGLDNAISSAINTQLAKSDPFFTTELTEKLFENTTPTLGKPHGLDLVSLNIQRGRDHGLPSYSEWRKHCGLTSTDTWQQMENAVDSDSLLRMKEIYNEPKDIDVYTGALSEPPINGAIVGPLLACMLGDQFLRLKVGDSFWYERNIGPQRFTRDQREEIYKTTLAGIICTNSDNVQETQTYLMRSISQENKIVNCSSLPSFNFDHWKENNKTNDRHSISGDTMKSNILILERKENETDQRYVLGAN